MNNENRIAFVWKLLRYSYGAVIFLAGLDKVFGINLIVDWSKYTSPSMVSMLPISLPAFMVIVGIIEVAVAILIFTKWNRLAFYIVVAWLVLISINLLMHGGYNDIAIRDLLLAVGAFSVAELAAILGYSISGGKMINA